MDEIKHRDSTAGHDHMAESQYRYQVPPRNGFDAGQTSIEPVTSNLQPVNPQPVPELGAAMMAKNSLSGSEKIGGRQPAPHCCSSLGFEK